MASIKVVINKCFGGFGLSDEAYEELLKMGMKLTKYNKDGRVKDENADIIDMWDNSEYKNAGKYRGMMGRYYFVADRDDSKLRTDKRLVKIVEKMGEKANGNCAKLGLVQIPDDVKWEIEEYDGNETVREISRSWG